jgi:site-specific recombinase XerD
MSLKQPHITFIFDRRKKASLSKKGSLEVRITHDYKQKYISTGISLYSNQWRNGKILNCPDILQISQSLDKLLTNIRQIILDMMDEGNININEIPDRLNKMNKEVITFLEFCEQRATIRKYGKKKDTQERYTRFLRLFRNWGGIQKFKDVTEDNIISYDKYLKSLGMANYSKWNNYHRFLNGFILDAINEALLQRNPYNWLNIDKDKQSLGINKYLTLLEFQQLKDAKMPTESLEKVRDLFVFQTYTCLRYSDLVRFNTNNITIINGTEVYKCTQEKTKKDATIPLLKPALDILDKYKGFLPIISNVKYNLYLKSVAQTAGIDKPLSTHWARHTGATILLNEGVDTKIVSKICGHSSTRITEQVYAKLLDETVVKAVDAVKNKL